MPKKKEQKNRFEEGVENFAEEMEALGRRLEHKANKHTECCKSHPLVPLLSSILCIIVLGIFIWLIDFLNLGAISIFFTSLKTFLVNNLALFFLATLIFSYSDHLSKKHRWFKASVPVFFAGKVIYGLWILGNLILIVNESLNNSFLASVASFMMNNSLWLFPLIVIVGYVVLVLKFTCCAAELEKEVKVKKEKPASVRRLHRSGKERILGGVCGGIAEYLNVDPVLIRLLWVAAALTFGSGVILYIIAWIIIPRNPRHEWKDD